MMEWNTAELSAFIERSWHFHIGRNGGDQFDAVKRTAQDVGSHYGMLPDDALAAVWRLAPDR